jgi:molecular chaperone DnaJ
VPTLGGEPVRLRVAAGTPSGRVLRVKGRGVSTDKGKGDLLATVQVAVPSHLSDTAKKHLEAFAQSMPQDNPRAELIERAGGLR